MASTSTNRTSLSARSPTPAQPDHQPPNKHSAALKHAPGVRSLQKDAKKQLCAVKAVDIKVSSWDPVKAVTGFLHIPQNFRHEESEGREKTAAVLLSGAGGGVVGPSSIYLSIADKIASLNRGIPVLRLDYRYPARNRYCVSDILAGMDYLRKGHGINRFVLVGWSFGGAPVFTVGGSDDRVVACATVASQTAETDGIADVARKALPTLLLHGTADQTLSPRCSQNLSDL